MGDLVKLTILVHVFVCGFLKSSAIGVSETVSVEDLVVHPSGTVIPVASSVQHTEVASPVVPAQVGVVGAAPVVAPGVMEDTVTVEDSVIHPSGVAIPISSSASSVTNPIAVPVVGLPIANMAPFAYYGALPSPIVTPIYGRFVRGFYGAVPGGNGAAVVDEETVEDTLQPVVVPVVTGVQDSVQVSDSVITPTGEVEIGHTSETTEVAAGNFKRSFRPLSLLNATTNRRIMLSDLEAAQKNVSFPNAIIFINPIFIKPNTSFTNKSINVYNAFMIPLYFSNLYPAGIHIANSTKVSIKQSKANVTRDAERFVPMSRENPDIHEIVRQHSGFENNSYSNSSKFENTSKLNTVLVGKATGLHFLDGKDEEPPVTKEKLKIAARLYELEGKNLLMSNSSDIRNKHANFNASERFY